MIEGGLKERRDKSAEASNIFLFFLKKEDQYGVESDGGMEVDG